MDRTKRLGEAPIGKLLIDFSLPAIVAMLVNAVYNVVDRVFIGRYVGESALAGLTIVFPVMILIFAVAGLIGIGGAALNAIKLGEQDIDSAKHVFGNTLSFGLIATGIVLVIFRSNLDHVLHMMGAEGEVYESAYRYLHIILAGFIFQMMSFLLSGFVRNEGRPRLAMMAQILSALANIVLDFIFIVILGWGVAGAAVATILGQMLGLAIYISYYTGGQSINRFKMRELLPDLKVGMHICTIGFASFTSTVGVSLAFVFMNAGLVEYGGTAAIASLGAINSLYTLFIMPIMGMTSGMQPIVGYNYGAGNMKRVFHILGLSLVTGSAFSTVVFVLIMWQAPGLVQIFLEPGSETVAVASTGLRIFVVMLPLLCINLMGTSFFQAIDKGKISMVLGLLRHFVFLLPLVVLFPRIWGLNGIWIATPVSDGLAILVTGLVLARFYVQTDKVVELQEEEEL